ncbi:hypothetical protein RIR_jg31259.t1 [Rhizophagus irregularis DAOM 181602=DAOM 197198]|nr:hypothetical protein RIR_jg31259.t1 [Rhizophagus irregularis DAOM 181602=DAOM 197198]
MISTGNFRSTKPRSGLVTPTNKIRRSKNLNWPSGSLFTSKLTSGPLFPSKLNAKKPTYVKKEIQFFLEIPYNTISPKRKFEREKSCHFRQKFANQGHLFEAINESPIFVVNTKLPFSNYFNSLIYYLQNSNQEGNTV